MAHVLVIDGRIARVAKPVIRILDAHPVTLVAVGALLGAGRLRKLGNLVHHSSAGRGGGRLRRRESGGSGKKQGSKRQAHGYGSFSVPAPGWRSGVTRHN